MSATKTKKETTVTVTMPKWLWTKIVNETSYEAIVAMDAVSKAGKFEQWTKK